MSQKRTFLDSEGAAWVERNKDKSRVENDLVLEVMRGMPHPGEVLEIGCGDGWRLRSIRESFGSVCAGVDPGLSAFSSGVVFLHKSTAENVPYEDRTFEVIIYGFCLYLTDREDLFKIVTEGDRLLKEGGYLIIHDFANNGVYAREYKHKYGILSYHMDYAGLWMANPAYRIVTSISREDECVTVLRKCNNIAYDIVP